MRLISIRTLIGGAVVAVCAMSLGAQEPPSATVGEQRLVNSQEETTAFWPVERSLREAQVPSGFRLTAFASEPMVQQPVAMTFDERGRLWVAENYTYAEQQKNFDRTYHDRIIILEDDDGDGRADRRKVFWDQAQVLTSIEIGRGGVWALCPPQLWFIPDQDRDDRPDGPPIAVLDGWADDRVRHNFSNGLRWGPDGWLYGRQGILETSYVGVPGTASDRRVPMNVGIWRYHPARRKFEVVCHGTTNPFGMDWNAAGELFFINTVIGHLWHAVPGAHFKRMYGDDFDPHLYDLIDQTADHVHWDAKNEPWQAQRTGVSSATDLAGGGHAHSGLMIYQGGKWPTEFHGDLLTVNLHGRRLNRDHLQRSGATYMATHRPDFLRMNDPWFRAVELATGPDGDLLILDWTDIGECHENDGVHRTSGRVYKLAWEGNDAANGQAHAANDTFGSLDLQRMSDEELVRFVTHQNQWFVRQAQRVLADRYAVGEPLDTAKQVLSELHEQSPDWQVRLRALWFLNAVGGVTDELAVRELVDDNEHLRVWGVRLLVDQGAPSPEATAALHQLAERERSGLVLTYLASAMQRVPNQDRWPIAMALVKHTEFATDRVLPLMIWYGIEPAVVEDPDRALDLVRQSASNLLTRHVARRLMNEASERPELAELLVARLQSLTDEVQVEAMLSGMVDALEGVRQLPPPDNWGALSRRLRSAEVSQWLPLERELSLVFGDGRAVDELQRIARDKQATIASRRQAVRSLVDTRTQGIESLLFQLLNDADVVDEALRGLGLANRVEIAERIVEQYGQMAPQGHLAAIEVLASRSEWAAALLRAVEQGAIPARDVPSHVLRQIQFLGNDELGEKIAQLWPEHRMLAGDRVEQMNRLKGQLDEKTISSANAASGRVTFQKVCGTCHRLFGEGEQIGPDLTGGQRDNLVYWLENILDPSATVAENFQLSIVETEDGRVFSGVVSPVPPGRIAVQTATERLVFAEEEIYEINPSKLSLMPDGLLADLTSAELADLFAYLMSK